MVGEELNSDWDRDGGKIRVVNVEMRPQLQHPQTELQMEWMDVGMGVGGAGEK